MSFDLISVLSHTLSCLGKRMGSPFFNWLIQLHQEQLILPPRLNDYELLEYFMTT